MSTDVCSEICCDPSTAAYLTFEGISAIGTFQAYRLALLFDEQFVRNITGSVIAAVTALGTWNEQRSKTIVPTVSHQREVRS